MYQQIQCFALGQYVKVSNRRCHLDNILHVGVMMWCVVTIYILLAFSTVNMLRVLPLMSFLLPQQEGTLEGRITNYIGEGMEGVTVIIEGQQARYETITDENGRYSQRLPAGTYRINADFNGYFYPLRRATFRVKPDAVTTINIRPIIRISEVRLVLDPETRQTRDDYNVVPPPKYDTPTLPRQHHDSLDLVITYDRKRNYRHVTEYIAGASATYDALTIYADTIHFNRRTFQLTAIGDVIIENNGQSLRTRRAVINFATESPIETLSTR
jgi:hypothetical protein